jgi:mannosylglycerate hydrolase
MTNDVRSDLHVQGIFLVPHTHWDREWYEPFQVFRLRLVALMDDVIARAEADPDFRFTLDGQTAAIEDYLEIKPQNVERVRALVQSGKLAIGPWQILLDEFLCSGETIIRNLEMGWKGAEALGGAMPVGYLPDMFGHVAQMPQILARSGIRFAALWRGVPSSVTGHSFRWESPDGSAVGVEYLFDGYGNGLDLFAVADKIPDALREYAEQTRSRYGDADILGMVGTDHLPPHPELMSRVQRHHTEAFPIRVGTMEEYFSQRATDPANLTVVRGELRSHARGNILPGVLSVRRHLKQLMAEAERTVDEAERLSSLHSVRNYDEYLRMAWRRIIESTAHDSVVGSGTDETVSQVAARLEEAIQIARAVRDEVLSDLALAVPTDSYLVANTLPVDRRVMVELEVAAPSTDEGVIAALPDGQGLCVQEIGHNDTVLGDEWIDAGDLQRVINRIHRRELFGLLIDTYDLEPGQLTIQVAEVPSNQEFDIHRFKNDLLALARTTTGPWRVRTIAQARRRVLVEVPVPALGFTTIRVGQGTPQEPTDGVRATARTLDNGVVRVEVADDGTFSMRGADGSELVGAGRIVDGGDRGDSYNYGPPANDALVSQPSEVRIELAESGPVRAVLSVRRVFAWPVALGEDRDRRSTRTQPTEVLTRLELRRGEPVVRVTVEYVNQSADHRVRFHVPLPEKVRGSSAEGQFAVTDRALDNEGGWGEFPLPTFPAYRFASAGPATLLLQHATEYEVVDGQELAVTLSRSVGSISVNLHPHRDEPAASEIPIPGGQELGAHFVTELALLIGAQGWEGSGAVESADAFRSRPLTILGREATGLRSPGQHAGLSVSGRQIHLSSVRRVDGAVEVRLVSLNDLPATAVLTGRFEHATFTDLLGRTLHGAEADGAVEIRFGPWEIVTLRLAMRR